MSSVDPQIPPAAFEGTRRSYGIGSLDESDVDHDPFLQLRRWLDDAIGAEVLEPTAMTVSSLGSVTVCTRARCCCASSRRRASCSSRTVTATRAWSSRAHPHCAAQLLWLDLHRQVRVEGVARLLDDGEADAYFAGRPRGSQIGAWASPQSHVLKDRAELEARVADAEERFADADTVPRPPNWGGYRIEPDFFEFWQGRPSRLHDRLRYRLTPDGHWLLDRLAP